MQSVQYEAPTSLHQAVQILERSSGAKILAGGTDLLVQMKLGLRQPALIVDIKNIPELMQLTLGDQGLRLGAAVPGAVVTDNPEVSDDRESCRMQYCRSRRGASCRRRRFQYRPAHQLPRR